MAEVTGSSPVALIWFLCGVLQASAMPCISASPDTLSGIAFRTSPEFVGGCRAAFHIACFDSVSDGLGAIALDHAVAGLRYGGWISEPRPWAAIGYSAASSVALRRS